MASTQLGPRRSGWDRPVSIPADLRRLRGPTNGRVTLPLSLYSSGRGSQRVFDLDNEAERIELYEIVLAEGTEDDVCNYINLQEMQRLWPRLWLPQHVRRAWDPVMAATA